MGELRPLLLKVNKLSHPSPLPLSLPPSLLSQLLSVLSSGEKFLLQWFRGYLISVIYGGRGGAARGGAKPGARDVMTLSIYDIQNQFVGEYSLLSTECSILSTEFSILRVYYSLASLPGDVQVSCGGRSQ